MIKNNLQKAFCLGVIACLAAGVCSPSADAARRRTFKSTPAAEQPAVAPALEEEQSEQVVAQPSKQAPANQSRSSRRKASLPDDSDQTAVNPSVRNQPDAASKQAASKSMSKPASPSVKKAAYAKGNVKEKEKSALQSIKVSKPNLQKIKEETLNPSSKFYYPKLWEKYISKSPNMSPEEFRHLYLGYMFQEDYDPYRSSAYVELTEPFQDKTEFTRAELEELIANLEKSLNDNPFDLRQMSFLVRMLKAHNKPNKAGIWELRLENLLAAIKSTGTGLDVGNAWYVIYPMHEYDMVQLLGYRAVDIDYDNEGFDHLLVEPDGSVKINKPVKGFFFNVEIPQIEYMSKHPEDQGADM